MKKVLNHKRKNDTRTHKISIADVIKLPYQIELTPISKENGGGYLASIPLLHGCKSDGKTPDEAIKNLKEAQRAWLESALKHKDPIPVPQ